jgi:uncharacterized protein with NRDE domain
MCLVVVALDAHPRYALLIAANRDEFHHRAAAAAHWWDDGWLAGRDLVGGGTWLGIDRRGRWALLTNVREPSRFDAGAPTRGTLVPQLLRAGAGPEAALRSVIGPDAARHNGFNLLAGCGTDACWGSNRAVEITALRTGVHGLSNAALDTPWPKLQRAKAALAAWTCNAAAEPDDALGFLADTTPVDDADLPSTGVPLKWERRLAPAFIIGSEYGTRSSTVVAVDRNGEATFVERSFDVGGRAVGEARHRFTLQPR